MIVRIATEGQYEIPDGDMTELDRLDNEAASACQTSDEASFHQSFTRLLDFVREKGRAVPDDELVGSDITLPPPDASLAEARSGFEGEGLIPT